jgi:O-antigen chain-terminating methyltransferase
MNESNNLKNEPLQTQLKSLVEELPEIYQPIYGLENVFKTYSRTTIDRLASIRTITRALKKKYSRPLRILDLGCAQGYISFSLAEEGHSILAIDHLDKNINLCNKLKDIYPDYDIHFECSDIEISVEAINTADYDLVICLSVLHHIVHDHGLAVTLQLIEKLACNVCAAIFEFALHSEPLYWAKSQPKSERDLLDSYLFIHCASQHDTHLSEIKRPLYYASNHYWFADGCCGDILKYSNKSHKLSEITNDRKYYFSKDAIIKIFTKTPQNNGRAGDDLIDEANFLKSVPIDLNAPQLISFGSNQYETWLIRKFINGSLLLDIFHNLNNDEIHQVLVNITEQLMLLEKNKLYHNDLRLWNVIVSENLCTTLIDYGAIKSINSDCQWPSNGFLSYFIFVYELTSGNVGKYMISRPPFISPFNLPTPYNLILSRIWDLPYNLWSFKYIHNILINSKGLPDEANHFSPTTLWIKSIENYLNAERNFLESNNLHLNNLIRKANIVLNPVRKIRNSKFVKFLCNVYIRYLK